MKLPGIMIAAVLGAAAAVGQAFADAPATDDMIDRRIAQLIEQLGDKQFAARQRAQQELVKLGFDAFDALADAEASDDPEIAMQAGYLVRLIRAEWTREGDPRQVQQILKDYEAQPDDRRLQRIKQLAELPGDQGLEWLCRLVRFEKSSVLSKQAALAIIGESFEGDEAAKAARVATIQKTLARGRRPAARWLLTYAQSLDDPAGALDKWTALTDAERQMLEQHPQESQNQIVMDLLKRKIELLDRLGRSDQAPEVMHQMALVERGDSASLTELIEWLVKRKAWPAIHEVATRFSASFDADAMLLYTLCEAHLAEGHRDQADQLAERALKLNGDSPQEHAAAAEALVNRGLIDWAQREWSHIITLGPIGSQTDVDARRQLAERLHDQQRDQDAAQTIRSLLDAAEKDTNVNQRLRSQTQQGETSPASLRATIYYYLACDAAGKKDLAAQRQYLDKSLQQDRKNIEALIGLYQMTGDEPAKRAELAKLVKEVLDDCRAKIDDAAEEHPYYNRYVSNYNNQIAWLIANTEGDIDEAIRLSHKSIELARTAGEGKRVGGLLDTLGHCYFAKKDYANAVKYQSEAAVLDPNTQAIGRQLKVFREALARQQGDGK